jgi:hypothetical protein
MAKGDMKETPNNVNNRKPKKIMMILLLRQTSFTLMKNKPDVDVAVTISTLPAA